MADEITNQAELEAIQRNLFEENRRSLERSKVLFFGGPVDGQTTEVPNGVSEMKVHTAFGLVPYKRDSIRKNVFVPVTIMDEAPGEL